MDHGPSPDDRELEHLPFGRATVPPSALGWRRPAAQDLVYFAGACGSFSIVTLLPVQPFGKVFTTNIAGPSLFFPALPRKFQGRLL